jgi:chemotaxis protein MotB
MKSNTPIVILAVLLAGFSIAAGMLAFKLNSTQTALEASRQRTDRLRSDISDLKTQAARLSTEESKVRQCTNELEAVKKDLAQAKSELTRKEQTWRETRQNSKASFAAEKQALTQQLSAARENRQASENRIRELQQQLAEMQTRLVDARKKTSQVENQVTACEQQIATLEQAKAAMEEVTAQAQENSAARAQEIKQLTDQIGRLKALVENKNNEMEKISFRSQAAAEMMQEKITALESRNSTLKVQNDRSERQIAALNAQSSDLEPLQADLKQTHADLEAANEKVAQLRAELHAAVTEIDRLKNETAELRGKLAAAETALSEKTYTVETLNEALEDTGEQIGIYKDRLETISGTKSRIAAEFQRFKKTHNSLVTDLEQQITDKEITVDRLQQRITITFIDQILFSSGRASLNRKGKELLDKVGRILKKESQDREIMVVGHTDNLPIHKDFRDKYTTNWELSAHRAASVVRYLQYKTGVDPASLSAVGRGFYEPVAGNDTPEGRAQNRRVEIIIAPKLDTSETI